MLPDFIQFDLLFTSVAQIDNRDLTQLTLFNGSTGANYADQLPGSFSFSRSGINISVGGEGFVYVNGVPTGGSVDGMEVKIGNAKAYAFQDNFVGAQEYPFSLFTGTDPLVIAGALFAGNDLLNGSPLDDLIYGFAGDDQLNGGNGHDRLYGQAGNDQLSGGRDDDRLLGGAGDDWLSGGSGTNILNGGEGSDTVSYFRKFSPVILTLKNGKTTKVKIGSDQFDKLKSVENVLGSLGADKLTGNRRNNEFDGDAGNDILNGKGGNDKLSGDYGFDTLIGGKGNDIFWFDKLLGTGGFTGSLNTDKIMDFGVGDDSIHLRQLIFGELSLGVLSPTNFLAAPGAISGINGLQFIVYNTLNGALYYDSSGNGTAAVIFQFATLKGAPKISAADFFVVQAPEDVNI